jgi:glutamyl-tRNA(Gln) amidotransferase subunit D
MFKKNNYVMISKEELSKIEPFSQVLVKTKNQSYNGKFLPQEGKYIVLKLPSGYNIGLNPENILSVDVIEEVDHSQETEQKQEMILKENENEDLQRLRILHTGGTIASKVDYKTGGVIADFKPEALVQMFPELTKIAKIESEFLGNMFSDDFRFAHFNRISNAVLKAVKEGVKNIIVTSGTDFLHYLSAALSFTLKDFERWSSCCRFSKK